MKKPIDELKKMDDDELTEYLGRQDIFTEEEWELHQKQFEDFEHIITSKTIEVGGKRYDLIVGCISDGEYPDDMNTSIHVVEESG